MTLMSAPESAVWGQALVASALALPVAGSLACVLLGERWSRFVALLLAPVMVAVSIAVAVAVHLNGAAIFLVVGGWRPPLGIQLRADGLASSLLITAAIVVGATTWFAFGDQDESTPRPGGITGARRSASFWPLLLGVEAGVSAAFLCNDLFSLFVALEMLTFAAVPLVSLGGSVSSAAAALQYMLFALMGSFLYLVGVVLLYAACGTLDIGLLGQRSLDDSVVLLALAIMSVGLFAKAALFPLHFWLPPAHGGALPAASAVLSALVVKGAFFVALRLWIDVQPGLLASPAAQVVAGLGAGAILFGSVVALQQTRLKPLIAYSTVAQIGYLFLLFGLLAEPDESTGVAVSSMVLTAAVLQVGSHALAKAAMFLAAGRITDVAGHDRLDGLAGVARILPRCVIAFAIAGLALMGVPPSGGFWAKWLLLTASVETGHWWWGMIIVIGGLLSGGYVYRAVVSMTAAPAEPVTPGAGVIPRGSPWRSRDMAPLLLAMASLLLGFLALKPVKLIQVGRGPTADQHMEATAR
ncbi:MAG: hypothetical protein KDA22_07400 [Phycisphaerales bacterium]|nr:hypothetical protein [Phycisphaerales bacterium]